MIFENYTLIIIQLQYENSAFRSEVSGPIYSSIMPLYPQDVSHLTTRCRTPGTRSLAGSRRWPGRGSFQSEIADERRNLKDNGIQTGRVRCGDALMGAGGRKPPRQTRLRLDCVERSGIILRDWEDACMMFLGEDYMAVSHLVEG
jgi:hypothetical protein